MKRKTLKRRPDRKRWIEANVARRFVAALPQLAGANLKHADRPDFRLRVGAATYGLELTALVRGSHEPGISPKQRMEWRRAVERDALRIWRRRRLPPMFVSLHWRDDSPLTLRVDVARQLVAAVHLLSRDLSPGKWLHVNYESEVPPEIRDHVRALSIVAARTRKGELWASGFAAFSEVQPNDLQREINRKSKPASAYPSRPDGLWLLIYSTGLGSAELIDVSEAAQGAVYSRGAFDRVFFLDFVGRLIELRLKEAAAA